MQIYFVKWYDQVSNAFDRSRNTLIRISLLSILVTIMSISSDSVEYLALTPY